MVGNIYEYNQYLLKIYYNYYYIDLLLYIEKIVVFPLEKNNLFQLKRKYFFYKNIN